MADAFAAEHRSPTNDPASESLTQDAKDAIDYANGVIRSEESGENKFQRAISAWRNINLSQLVPSLDTTASDLATHQRDALVERKELAQKTKEFRKLEDAAKLTEIKSLLKAYQTYIDLITNQSKAVSASFFQVYSSLSEAPDPYPLLEASVESLVVADETLPKLQDDNKHLQITTSKLSTQLEEAEKKLQEERTIRRTMEESQERKVKEVEASWSAVLAEKQDNWASREKVLEEKAENQERLLKELKASYEVSQRLGEDDNIKHHRGNGDANALEFEIISLDLERANARIADVESRNERLRLDLVQATAPKDENLYALPVEEDPAFLRLRSENTSLIRRIEAIRFERESERRDWDLTTRNLRKELVAMKDDSAALKAKVERWCDYDEISKELEILKSIEFSTGEIDEIENQQGSALLSSITDSSRSSKQLDGQNLEQLLLARNKKVNNELTVLRVSHQDLVNRLETLQEDLSTTNMELERSKNLTITLENDLARVQSEGSAPPPAMSVTGTYTSRYPASSMRRGRLSPASSIISGMDPGQSPGGTLENLRTSEQNSGGSGILPMITAQRDRFKKRISELEGELSSSYQTVSSLRSEVASLQKDNLSLYEKTRYVSTYNQIQSPVSSSAYPLKSNPSSISISDGNTPLDRYRSAYESKISPFAAFRGRETARAFKRMTFPERALFQVARFVLANRTSRNLFAVYFLGLHISIFFMLFTSTPQDVQTPADVLNSGDPT